MLSWNKLNSSVNSVVQSCLTLCDPMDCSTPGLPVHHHLLELAQTHVHSVGDASQPSHPLSSPSSPAFNLAQHQSLFKWVSSLHRVAKVLEFQLQHQSFQWLFRNWFPLSQVIAKKSINTKPYKVRRWTLPFTAPILTLELTILNG